MAGLGATLHFTTGRVFPLNHSFSNYGRWGKPRHLREAELSEGIYYPSDTAIDGCSMLEVKILLLDHYARS